MNLPDFPFYIGTIVKSHGHKGEVFVKTCADICLKKKSEPVFIEIDGLLVPFFVVSSKPAANGLIIMFDDIASSEKVRRFYGCRIFADKKNIKFHSLADAYFDNEQLNGYLVLNAGNEYAGRIKRFIGDSKNPLLEVETDQHNYYIPVLADFITAVDQNERVIHVQLPPEIINLNKTKQR